jgi:WD40 repeat protein
MAFQRRGGKRPGDRVRRKGSSSETHDCQSADEKAFVLLLAVGIWVMLQSVNSPGRIAGQPTVVSTTAPLALQSVEGPIYHLAWSPDGKVIATATPKGIVLFDAVTLSPFQTIDPRERAESLAYSPDGRRLACICGEGLIKIWDVKSGQLLRTLTDDKFFTSVAFNPNGAQIASGDFDGNVKVWDANGDQLQFTLAGPKASVFRLAFSSDGLRILSGNLSGTVKVWHAITSEVIYASLENGGFFDIQFSADGRRMATSNQSGDAIKVWDATTGQLLTTLAPTRVFQFTFANHSGTIVCLCQEGVLVWDARNGQSLGKLAGYGPDISQIAASPDGKRLAIGTRDGHVKTLNWSLPTRTPPMVLG